LSYVAITGISLLTIPFFISKLGIEVYGIFILITSITGYFNLLDLGLTEGVIKFVSEFAAKKQLRYVYIIVNSSLIFQCFLGIILSVVVIVFSPNILSFLKVNIEKVPDVNTGLRISCIGFITSLLIGIFISTINGLQRFDITSKVNLLSNIVLNVSIIFLLLTGAKLFSLLILNILVNFLSLLLYFYFTRSLLPSWNFKFNLNFKLLKKVFFYSSVIFTSKITNFFSNYIVKFIISYFLGVKAVGIYTIAYKLIAALGGLLSSMFNILFPYTSELNAQRDIKSINDLFRRSSQLASCISFSMFFILFCFSKSLLTLWLGSSSAEEIYYILKLLCVSTFFASLTSIPMILLMGLGNSRLIAGFSLFTFLLYLVFIPIFTKYYLLSGTAFAMVLSSILSFVTVSIFTSKVIKYNILTYYKNVLLVNIPFLILNIGLIYFLKYFNFNISIILQLIISSFLAIITYAFILKGILIEGYRKL